MLLYVTIWRTITYRLYFAILILYEAVTTERVVSFFASISINTVMDNVI